MHWWLCSPPTNSSCHTSNVRLLYFYSSLGLATVCAYCSGRNVSASPVLRDADTVLYNRHLLLELLLGADVSFERIREGNLWKRGRKTLWLCLVPGNGRCWSTAAATVLCLPITEFSCHMCWPLRQEYWLYPSTPQDCRVCPLWPLSLSRPFPLPVSSDSPTFRCFNAWISQTCLCIKQGTFCWITAVQLLTLRGEIRRTSHNAMLLTSPSTTPLYIKSINTLPYLLQIFFKLIPVNFEVIKSTDFPPFLFYSMLQNLEKYFS